MGVFFVLFGCGVENRGQVHASKDPPRVHTPTKQCRCLQILRDATLIYGLVGAPGGFFATQRFVMVPNLISLGSRSAMVTRG